jgi:hypothetical protein
MELPVLNKEGANFAEILGISKERAKELDADIQITVKPGFTILAKITSTYLNRAKTVNEQLVCILMAKMAAEDFMRQSGIDVTQMVQSTLTLGSTDAPEDDDQY